MPYIDDDEVYYPSIDGNKKYSLIKSAILKMYVFNLENKIYPYDIIYPNR